MNVAPLSSQSCVITQQGGTNRAAIAQTIDQRNKQIANARQFASVTQAPATGGTTSANDLELIQIVWQFTGNGDDDRRNLSPSPTQTQNANQSAEISQTAAGSGRNLLDLHQNQRQNAFSGINQSQNTAGLPAGFADCAVGAPAAPNACADVFQKSEAGKNTSSLDQLISETETARVVTTQKQGASDGGAESNVHQETLTGSSSNNSNQRKRHTQVAPAGSSQTQFDPVRCCGTASQVGGTGNTDTINQSAILNANQPDAVQSVNLLAESVSPTGSCTATQFAQINGASTPNTSSSNPCPLQVLQSSCGGGECTASPPIIGTPASQLSKGVRLQGRDQQFGTTATAQTNDTLEYQIVYSNTGNTSANNVVITDTVPEGTTFEGCNNECSYNPDNNLMTWSLGTVRPDTSRTMTFLADVTAESGTITNTANGDTAEEPPFSSNPTTVAVINLPLSVLDKGVRNLSRQETAFTPSTQASSGDTVEFQITYSNTGLGTAHSVTVTDVIPAGIGFISCSDACTVDGSTLTWNLGDVPSDNSTSVTFQGTFGCGAGDAQNTATADSKEEEPVNSNAATVVNGC